MDELSRVSRQSQIEQARRARYSMEPTFDSLEFDDWMENIFQVPRPALRSGTEESANNNFPH